MMFLARTRLLSYVSNVLIVLLLCERSVVTQEKEKAPVFLYSTSNDLEQSFQLETGNLLTSYTDYIVRLTFFACRVSSYLKCFRLCFQCDYPPKPECDSSVWQNECSCMCVCLSVCKWFFRGFLCFSNRVSAGGQGFLQLAKVDRLATQQHDYHKLISNTVQHLTLKLGVRHYDTSNILIAHHCNKP